jgi:hypothetical protein
MMIMTWKKFNFFQFARCGYIKLLSALIPDCKYVIFLLVNRKCKMLQSASALNTNTAESITMPRFHSRPGPSPESGFIGLKCLRKRKRGKHVTQSHNSLLQIFSTVTWSLHDKTVISSIVATCLLCLWYVIITHTEIR